VVEHKVSNNESNGTAHNLAHSNNDIKRSFLLRHWQPREVESNKWLIVQNQSDEIEEENREENYQLCFHEHVVRFINLLLPGTVHKDQWVSVSIDGSEKHNVETHGLGEQPCEHPLMFSKTYWR